ncbi:5-hydroxytryptamine receptor 3A-like [Saccostrea echinata]|uniref:5-hydroxytryptamine receptor 3A-like n=1 Tax=Saccostrea echinata TaxID=191078 RepID=UPI002A81FD71|nr:5-hydroxytryptamine receptor 3A-like [Saccostrea echinata]
MNIFTTLVLLGVILTVQPILGDDSSTSSYKLFMSLHDKLLKNYRKDIRPVWNQQNPVRVSIDIIPRSIIYFDEMSGILAASFGLDITWKDEIITWDPISYPNITYIRLPPSSMWRPRLFSSNAFDTFALDTLESNSVVYSYDGTALYILGVRSSTLCSPNSRYFPFDIHTCYIDIIPLSSIHEVYFVANGVIDKVYEENPLWKLLSFNTSADNDEHFETSVFRIAIRLQRRHSFLLMNIFAPIVFLAIVNLGVFILPVESGERISFSLTVLLSFAVFLTLVTGNTPKSSITVSLFSIYMLIVLTYSTLITFSVIIVVDIHFTENGEKPKSPLSRMFVWFVHRTLTSNCRSTEIDIIAEEFDMDEFQEKRQTSCANYKTISLMLDNFFVLFYTFLFVTVTVFFMLYISYHSQNET